MWRAQINALIADQRRTLRLYSAGAIAFLVGLGLIQYANHLIEPSLQQELVALLGTLIGGGGFLTAIIAQIFLIIDRFRRMDRR